MSSTSMSLVSSSVDAIAFTAGTSEEGVSLDRRLALDLVVRTAISGSSETERAGLGVGSLASVPGVS